MAKLFCAIVGAVGTACKVKIDDVESVFALKKALKKRKKNDLKDVDADTLLLFLAKKEEGRGPWLTEEEMKKDVIDTTGLKFLGAARAKRQRMGLSDRDVYEGEEAGGRGPVNVLVMELSRQD